jgi:DNA-binding GntR family transcriptional regulator
MLDYLGHGVVRLIIERATAEDLDEIREYIADYKTVSDERAIKELVSKFARFHILLAKASHSLPLIVFTQILIEWSHRKLAPWFPSEDEQLRIFRFHEELFESIKAKDANRAQFMIKMHITEVSRRLFLHIGQGKGIPKTL